MGSGEEETEGVKRAESLHIQWGITDIKGKVPDGRRRLPLSLGLWGKREMAEEFRVLLLGNVYRPTTPSLPVEYLCLPVGGRVW